MDYQRSVHPSPRTKLGTLQLKLPGVSLESTLRERHYLAGPTYRRSHVERRWSVASTRRCRRVRSSTMSYRR